MLSERRRAHLLNALETSQVEYEATRNPLFAWNAYQICRELGCDFPDWVLRYLDESADALRQTMARVRDGETLKDHSGAAAEALGLKRGRGEKSIFDEYTDTRWIYLGATAELYIKQGDKPYVAIQDCAKRNNASYSTVDRAHKRYKASFE